MRTIALAHDSATYLQISVIFAFNTHSIAGETDREELMEKGWWFNLPKILFSKIVHLLNIAESLLSVRDISPVYTSPYTLWCFCWKKTVFLYITSHSTLHHQMMKGSTSYSQVFHSPHLCSFWLLRSWLLILEEWEVWAYTVYRTWTNL